MDQSWTSHRLCEATGDFEHTYGGTPGGNYFGDLGQLGPILDNDNHLKPKTNDSPATIAGYAIYRSFEDVIVLEETMRQGPDQKKPLERLLCIKNGTVTQNQWKDINNRYKGGLSRKTTFRS